jgi:hypothetical protein
LREITYLNKILQAVSLEEVKYDFGAKLSGLILNELTLGDCNDWRILHNAIGYIDKSVSIKHRKIKRDPDPYLFDFCLIGVE